MRSARPAPAVRKLFSRILPATAATITLLIAGTSGSAAAPPGAAPTPTPTVTPMTGPQLAASWTAPLSTRGRYVVDADGDRFKLKAGNWAGAQGTWEGSGDVNDPANHQADQISHNIPLGLDRAPISRITADFHALGLNTIRLPFANAMMRDTTVVPDSAVAANPQLKGKTPLQVFDAVVAALTADGFAVILNNHTTTYRFCCGLDGNERWNSSQSAEQWHEDWVSLVNRYKGNERVVGADLRNEIRRDTLHDPNWGRGDERDVYAAFELAGTRILKANPDMLVIMEGINWYGIPLDGLDYGRPMLTPVRELSNTLTTSGKLVYAAHFYGYTGPNYTGVDSGPGHTNDWPYEDFPLEKLKQLVHEEALFVTESGQHFTAPVWISEFGAGGRGSTDTKEQTWFGNFTDILVENDTDFAIWPLVGWTGTNGAPQDTWALVSYDAAGKRQSLSDPGDWRTTDWNKLVNAQGVTGPVAPVDHWNMLNLDFRDHNVSSRMLSRGDWSPGYRKGNCPDSQRLTGLGRGDKRGLCTDANQPAKGAGDWVAVHDDRYVTRGDWAEGYTKLQCPDNTFAVGYSVSGSAMAGLLCAPSAAPLPLTGRNVWFDKGDNRPATGGSVGSDWAPGHYKGQCTDQEYLAGVAFTWKWNHGGVPDALLCRPLN
ncbi:cellulase family glycosylhydrolase [Streptomyces sp. BE147]|uniref:glycoside hydrolase family 5 protein n=1 Tax=Streptomyces sp. BE147 TaxID=3002524 RepID=UPI002E788403|nr:cellulase family glycosylhydrolase [Streptomyces sp. BE147]MEE1742766.1 cellulase family glycosylhydrolase [Streptomyces sp. BE147]